MSTVLGNISKDTTRFTIFENDQVLTADQLNDLFNYLDVQTRLTRTRAIGIGIICGLEIGTLDVGNIVVSKGTAITTDGDLLHLDEDTVFDQYEVFEDVNARYPYFWSADKVIPIFELRNSELTGDLAGKTLSEFEQSTVTAFKDYIGVLYLEDYKNDPDICTGTDCDNKGAESAKNLKVLLVHKNNIQQLLQSMPPINKNYFSLEDITVPRVSIKTTIDTYAELNAAFNDVLIVKEDIKAKLKIAYQSCKTIVDDEFDNSDPTSGWDTLLDQAFNVTTSVYSQYVYDFARDLSFAYNELRETLFADNSICCPDINLFPKHVLMGLVKTATVTRIPDSPVSVPTRPIFTRPFDLINSRLQIFGDIRFNRGLVIKRYNPIHIDLEYRHHFYESPVLNNKDESIQQTRFCFMRINSMIKNFFIPTAADLKSVGDGLKITPGCFENKPLGDRSIPFYYRYNNQLPVNSYWNFKANVRKKESDILYYSSSSYTDKASTVTPFRFNILPYDFFRIEGHIGFKNQEVESAINNLILEHNLPFNLITVQVERNPLTIPKRQWFFPELQIQEAMVRNAFLDHINQVDFVHTSLKAQTANLPEATNINLSIDNFSNAKNKILTYQPISQPNFDVEGFKKDVQNVINATTDVKVQTKKFDFAHTAVPHDFVINTDIIGKADLIADLIKQKETKKIEDLMLGNFMKKNSGLEHAGGVLRGGTFVLVYTSNDGKVVADFMLPYFVADKDIVPDPPVIKPQPLPWKKLNFEKVFIPKPLYQVDLDALSIKYDDKITGFRQTLNNNEKLFERVVASTIPGKFQPGAYVNPGTDGVVVGGKDITGVVKEYGDMQRELADLPVNAPNRNEKEIALIDAAEKLTNVLNQPAVVADTGNAILVKSVLADIHSGTSLVTGKELQTKAADISNRANNITKGIKLIR